MQIQWYPGHMAKTRRILIEDLKLIDVVIVLVDARAPVSTSNPDFSSLFKNKTQVVVLNKADLADERATKRFLESYKAKGIIAMPFVSVSGNKKDITALIERAAAPAVERLKAKGISKTVRVMVTGIPNVGKSAFINRVVGTARTKTGDKPGVTRARQWVKISTYLEMMDTPGLLWPKLENAAYAKRLAYLGSIKDDIMDVEELAANLLIDLGGLCPNELYSRYNCINESTAKEELLDAVCESRGFLLSKNKWDTERAARIVLDEFRAGKIACITLDDPGEGLQI